MPARKKKEPEKKVEMEKPVEEMAVPRTPWGGVVVEPTVEQKVEPVAAVEEKPAMMLTPEVTPPVAAVVSEPVAAPAASVGDLAKTGVEVAAVVEKNEGEKSGGWAWLWVSVAFLVGMGLGAGGGYAIWGMGSGKWKLPSGGKPVAVATVTPKPQDKKIVEPTLAVMKREDLKIKVLNGSGVAGRAAAAKDFLVSLGYKNVETGNAATSDFESTGVEIKQAAKNYWETLRADLASRYEVDKTASDLEESDDFDAVVTVGKK